MVLEVGCGPALISVVAAEYAKHVITTDYLQIVCELVALEINLITFTKILNMAKTNAEINNIKNMTVQYEVFISIVLNRTRNLDWIAVSNGTATVKFFSFFHSHKQIGIARMRCNHRF